MTSKNTELSLGSSLAWDSRWAVTEKPTQPMNRATRGSNSGRWLIFIVGLRGTSAKTSDRRPSPVETS